MKQIRNFSIIAHIDHGKSTLADRFLEITGTVPKEKLIPQFLDKLELERERGITIKLAPATMNYKGTTLNLIDTPGHADFSYEVSRSLAAVEGVILLVDATKGVEAQTLSNFLLAKEQNLKIIPAINKIDMSNAQVSLVRKQVVESFRLGEEEIYEISAKQGTGVETLLEGLIAKIPQPTSSKDAHFKALIFDSFYDQFKGVVAYVRVFGGEVHSGQQVKLIGANKVATAASLGYFAPELKIKSSLQDGEVGWIATGLKEVQKVRVGDTISLADASISPLLGYKEIRPMVFAGIFPVNRDDFPKLREALEKLKLNDASLVFDPENSPALGFGVRAGFLGLLHMEIVQERLEREFDLELIISSPTVRYAVVKTDGNEIIVSNPQSLPPQTNIKQISEPWIQARVVSTKSYLGAITQLLYSRRAEIKNTEYFGDKITLFCNLPLSEVITDFYDKLKTVSSGYASFDYELSGYRPVEAIKLEILISKDPVDALSQIVLKKKAYEIGKSLVSKLKETIPRQQFEVSLQAAVGGSSTGSGQGRIIAAAKIPPFRKDVTAKLYGGDRTRKDKLLKKQKKGKRRMKRVGKVEIPQEAFLAVLKI